MANGEDAGDGAGDRRPFGAPGDPSSPRAGDEIIIAGQFYHTGTKVVTWLDPGGLNAYSCEPLLPAGAAPGAPPSLGVRLVEPSLFPVAR